MIGCGGVGSWLIHPLAATFKEASITVMDGDILEEKNLDRQRFSADQIGKNKAEAVAELYPWANLKFIPSYFLGSEDVASYTHLLVCVDNHPARSAALAACDMANIDCIIGANEYFDHQAYYYKPLWKGSISDPRKRYPEIDTDRSGSPVNCTGIAQESAPQLCMANLSCASLMLRLLWVWTHDAAKSDHPEKYPIELSGTIFKNNKYNMEELCTKQ